MRKPLRALRYLLGFTILFASLTVLYGWWRVRATLPQLEGAAALPGLKAEVSVDRDQWGVPTVTAASMEDLLVAQGYVCAQDRLWQMDFIRRIAGGELSEVLGEVALRNDRENRTYGFRQAAEASLAVMDPESKGHLEAYARGVNAYIEQRRGRFPIEFQVLGYEPRPWGPVDTLLVHAYMYDVLSTTWEWELNRARVEAKVGPERARQMFLVDSELDHIIVGADGAPGDAQPPRGKSTMDVPRNLPAAPPQPAGFLAEWRQEVEAVLGSNNWVVSGKRTYSGKPILANDTHLPLQIPDTWYMIHLKAPGYNAKGFALPGTPLVVIGHNERIAWGFTNNGADVQDLYAITFSPDKPGEYRANGAWVASEIRKEVIRVKDHPDVTHEVTVTRHGPIVHREGLTGYAVRWTALEPGGLGAGYSLLGRAQNWEEFLALMRGVSGPAQNAVYADVDGNIGMVVAARVPIRKKGSGAVPMPGDSDEFAWSGYIPFDQLPKTFNPPDGIIATANARVVGPGYRPHLTDRWYSPYRTDRIYKLLESRDALRPQDCIAIQTDTYSLPHKTLGERLFLAIKKHPPKDERVRNLMELYPQWDGLTHQGNWLMGLVEYTRRQLPEMILRPHLGEDFERYQWSRGQLFFDWLLRERPPEWLPAEFPDYDALLVAAAERAAQRLETDARGADVPQPEQARQWHWGRFMRLRILHPLARSGFLSRQVSITGVEQGGTGYSIKQTGRSIGPAMRFVADLDNWDNSLMNISVGQSGQFLSRNYRDQFVVWYEGTGVPSPFTDAAVQATTVKQLRLTPQ